MRLEGKRITFGITGSLYAIKQVIPQIQNLIKEGADIIPIMSFNYCEKVREVEESIKTVEEITHKSPLWTRGREYRKIAKHEKNLFCSI